MSASVDPAIVSAARPATAGTTMRLGTRRSALATWQTAYVAGLLRATWPDLHCETTAIDTTGDRVLDQPLPQIGGKGLFTAELERALRSGTIDVAVHSLKDLPVETEPDLLLGAIVARADARDVLVSGHGETLDELAPRASVGTSSPRRRAQLLALRPDLDVRSVRGNVETRVRTVRAGEIDAVVLAAAGLQRLGLEHEVAQQLSLEHMLPAPGQGALAVQCRADDRATMARLAPIHHAPTASAVGAERAFLQALGGGCAVPVAAHAQLRDDGSLFMRGMVSHPDGDRHVRVEGSGSASDPIALGRRLADEALQLGAAALLRHG